MELRHSDFLVAALLLVLVTAVTLAAASAQGINRDEAYYMHAAEQYVSYWEHTLTGRLEKPLSDASIARYWSYIWEHPPFMRLVDGVSWRLLHRCHCAEDRAWHPASAQLESGRHRTLALASETASFRLPTTIGFGLLGALVYLFFVEAFGVRPGALAAALLTVAQPRAFFHAATAGLDLPVATLWFATAYLYWRALARRTAWSFIVVGTVYGLFLATKLQAFFLPLALGAHWLAIGLRSRATKREGASAYEKPSRWPTPWPFIAMATIGPVVLLALWPWLWHETLARFLAYLRFHLHHVHYDFEYLGHNYEEPPFPWHEPVGMLLTTAPVMLLVLAAAGALVLARRGVGFFSEQLARDDRGTVMLLLLAGLAPVAPFFFGSVPIYGETKHWLATMPYIAIAAGVGLSRLAASLFEECGIRDRPLARAFVWTGLLAVAVAPAAVETAHSHPYGLSHYNALAGGAPGGADLGMNRQFWGYSVRGLLPWLNQRLPPNARLYLHDWNHDAYLVYLRERLLRPDIQDAGMEDPGIGGSDAALVIHEKHFDRYEYRIWSAYGTIQPAEVLTVDGVPLVTVYLRKR
jgi:hypothetical protein